ncbi:MAG: iron ABC transporter permease [Candidatus Omnitrophica bacterium]|nr:iron ABC transporter permease [Candidatus Omnitrophota bacterium]MCM8809412.1 iron ABC transporter permease [Candidatus Omnitrophota bacterium]MCM8810337.1 iron ABC transporter permease [Candidatus Omnitrophota bacterium]MCM8833209.1 iron ABC transporter permease [Candidatus Omnitrophota bacterium]
MKRKIVFTLILIFFLFSLVYPVSFILLQSFYHDGKFTLEILKIALTNYIIRKSIINSFLLGVIVVLTTSLIGIPLAFIFDRFSFKGKSILRILFLLPMIASPFVGSIGIKQILSRFGSLNILLIKLGLVKNPISWIGSGFLGIVILQTLHLYPIMFLNISASLNNYDISVEEASYNLGANAFQTFFKIIFPLILPGFFAASSIIFIWAITDLGTPLVFEFNNLVSVKIFYTLKDINTNPVGYALVFIILLLTLILFIFTKKYIGKTPYTTGRTQVQTKEKNLQGKKLFSLYIFLFLILLISLIPHFSLIFYSFSKKWFFSILPSEYTNEYYKIVFTHRLTKTGIFNSLIYSSVSTVIDILFGFLIGYILCRWKIKGKGLLDILSMMPLVIPGIVIAFGYVTTFSNTILDPRNNPIFLIILSYSLRRIPYLVRTTYSSFLQLDQGLEEASYSLGANNITTFKRIIFPLVSPGLFAGAILAFAFSLMEVSCSLILAIREKFYPISKVIYTLAGRVTDGPNTACSLGVLGMVITAISLFISTKIFAKKIGEFFRIG